MGQIKQKEGKETMLTSYLGNKLLLFAGGFLAITVLSSVMISWNSKNHAELNRWNKEYEICTKQVEQNNQKILGESIKS